MRHTPLKRLTSAEYMTIDIPLCIYRQMLYEPVEAHWHEFYELGFVFAGRGEHILNGVVQPLQRGSMFLLTPADFHAVSPHSELELFDVVFLADVLKEEVYRLLFQVLRNYTLIVPDSKLGEVESDFQRLWRESNARPIGSQLIMVGTLERILIDLLRESLALAPFTPGEVAIAQQQKLSMSLIYLHHHFREPLSLEEVAQQVHLSPSYFSECFHRAYGTSFQHYLQELRLNFAKSLLSAARLSVSHVCSASGFQTLSHFERTFKHRFGMSPRQFCKARYEPSS